MPNIWAHIQFGTEVLTAISAENYLNDPNWKTSFQLGCQGPDFLFYDHFWPWQASTPLNKLGSQMHNIRCGPFLLSLFEKARSRPLEDHVVAYTVGFLLHHLLDRHLHPYIFSLSGFKKWHHQRFETAMDSAVLYERAGVNTGTTPVCPQVNTRGKIPGEFALDFLSVVAEHYPVLAEQITPNQLDEAVAQFAKAQRVFFDPTGWKGKLAFGQLEPFSPPRQVPEWDVLNKANRPWVDPCDRTLVHTESAMELWDNALVDAVATTQAGIAWLYAGSDPEAITLRDRFKELLKDISYETGRPCGSAWITYADSIVPVN
ncbi:zinc dependent phospholipase C family protein [Cohnella sp.]|uniref:zinc dependent phospholipase C family protein n=1 Tax=Cohnella sp. TaxID=1883426 RepID=UPI0035660C2F